MPRRPNDPEVFADYDGFLDTDIWPTGTEQRWVGDMPPQYAAAAYAKLRRWALSQWSDEVKSLQEWDRVRVSKLGLHLSARAVGEDFTEASQATPVIHGLIGPLDRKESAVLLATCLHDLFDMSGDQIAARAVAITNWIYDRNHHLTQGGSQ